MAMTLEHYVEEKLSALLEDAHTRHLREKVENSLSGVAAGQVYTYQTARKEVDRISVSGVKVSKTGFGMFQQPIETKATKPQEEVVTRVQPTKPSK